MRILFITTVSLSEQLAGGTVYTRSLVKAFRAYGSVTLIELSKHQVVHNRVARGVLAAARSLFTSVPPNVLFHSGYIKGTDVSSLNQAWDVVVVDHLESALFADRFSAPKIYISHNLEFKLLPEKLYFLPRRMVAWLTKTVEKYEAKFAGSVEAVVSISREEAKWYEQLNRTVVHVPPAFEALYLKEQAFISDRLRIGFIGARTWRPNERAVAELFKAVLPRLSRDVCLIVAGAGWIGSSFAAAKVENERGLPIPIEYVGYVEDVSIFWQSIDVFLAPIVSGAGVNIKVCEALSQGLQTIAHRHAVRGLPKLDTQLLKIADTSDQIVDLIQTIEVRERRGEGPREFSEPYIRERIGDILQEVI